MCLRGLLVLFLGLVFLLPVASLPSLAPSSSIVPIACASILPTAHVQNVPLEKPAFGCAARAMLTAKRVHTQVKIQVKNTTLSLGGSGNAGIGTAVPTYALDVASGSIISRGTFVETASDTGAIIGMNSSTPRLWLGNGTSAQNLEIDNNGGVMRFISPGNIIMQASASPNTVTVNGILNATNYVVVGGTTSLNHSLDIYEHSGQAIAALNRSGNSDNMYFQLSPAGANSNSNVNWLMGVNGGSDKFSLGTWNGSSVATYLTINDNSGNGYVGHSDNRPGFRDAQIECGGREEVARSGDLRTPGNGRRNPVIVRRSASAPSVFGYCFGAIPPHCEPVFRAS